MNPSCSANELLKDISLHSTFSGSEELLKVHTSLAKKIITAQHATFDSTSNEFIRLFEGSPHRPAKDGVNMSGSDGRAMVSSLFENAWEDIKGYDDSVQQAQVEKLVDAIAKTDMFLYASLNTGAYSSDDINRFRDEASIARKGPTEIYRKALRTRLETRVADHYGKSWGDLNKMMRSGHEGNSDNYSMMAKPLITKMKTYLINLSQFSLYRQFVEKYCQQRLWGNSYKQFSALVNLVADILRRLELDEDELASYLENREEFSQPEYRKSAFTGGFKGYVKKHSVYVPRNYVFSEDEVAGPDAGEGMDTNDAGQGTDMNAETIQTRVNEDPAKMRLQEEEERTKLRSGGPQDISRWKKEATDFLSNFDPSGFNMMVAEKKSAIFLKNAMLEASAVNPEEPFADNPVDYDRASQKAMDFLTESFTGSNYERVVITMWMSLHTQ